ncbi:MAG: aromatic-ring-hydroxylating dioxygenase subunit beta [Pigmentiphaga sp.]|uniref:aromatic-ring-hydroxylating dioxygenase subunit beta n=1 Tax=Pigmentiphaga sp. TaxID=1977564 RepID=UPI0029BA25CF|nr:aromatic-ring-hydroxylating dioxygenase subunit beta [Pigmentiphaga sp.]MDX3907288.1 aromatic-ring-hydroxylating dioxygenase subunit beta [Pigmentiphaga sp.]
MIVSLPSESFFRPVENLVYEWARAIDENRVEDIAELMTPHGRYTVTSRFNSDRGLPLAVIDCTSAAQLRDRIKSMRIANVYEPQHYRHIISGVQIIGEEDGALAVRSNYLVVRTMELDGDMAIYSSGQCQDLVDVSGDRPRFKRRRILYDSRIIETLMVIPL